MNTHRNIKTSLKESRSSSSQVSGPSIAVNHPAVNALIRALAKQAAQEYFKKLQAANDNICLSKDVSS